MLQMLMPVSLIPSHVLENPPQQIQTKLLVLQRPRR